MLLFIIISLTIIYLILKLSAIITHKNCKSKVCLVGKTALVTGGNSGIGYQTVLNLAQRGCRVIIADKVQDPKLLENIYKETQSKNVLFKYVDLSSFNSVRALAKDVVNHEEKLDILVNNAGIGTMIEPATEDGLDITMQVNYLSPFLLTHLLVDLLKKAEGRVIFTSSKLAFLHNFTLAKLTSVDANDTVTYHNSKVCTIIAADIFGEKLEKYNITCNSYHPGVAYTNIYKNNRFANTTYIIWLRRKTFEYLSLVFGKTAEEGAQTAIHLACANEVEGVSKEFFYETKIISKPKLCYDKKQCAMIWKSTEEIVKLTTDEKL